jgi:AraC-like DNA-binding protein
LSVQFYRLKKAKTVSAAPAVDTITTRENVIHYIHVNISKVTIQSICDNFNISPIQLYEILEDDKPGEVIRKHRISLVRKFRKEKKDENFIAEHTGFSVSYLKKIF